MVPTFVDYVRQPPSPSLNDDVATTTTTPTPESGSEEKKGGGTLQDGGLSAIIMEYLPGEDMHLLRDRHCQSLLEKASADNNIIPTTPSAVAGEKAPRRLAVEDAVYLVADVMLPLLKAMHEVGMVHRDVKPSVSSSIICTYIYMVYCLIIYWPMKIKKL